MDTALENKLTQELAFVLSKALPDFVEVLKKNGIAQVLEVSVMSNLFDSAAAVMGCCLVNGRMKCPCPYGPGTIAKGELGLDEETSEQLCRNIEAQFIAIAPQVLPVIKEAKEPFEIVMKIDPANTEGLSCKFEQGVLTCA